MPNYEEVLERAHINVRQLGDQLAELEDLKESLRDARRIPDQWDAKFREVAATTREYTSSINAVANTYLQSSNTVIGNNLSELAAANTRLGEQIQTLRSYDFAGQFQALQREIAERVKADLRKEIEGISTATEELGTTNKAFRTEIERLHAVDLEAHFSRHQKLLSDVFNAINSINALLITVTQTLVRLETGLDNLRSGQEKVLTAIANNEKRLTNEFTENRAATERLRSFTIILLILIVLALVLFAYVAFFR